MRFGILGSLEVSGPNGPIVIAGKIRRALLMRLLIAANTPVDTGRLFEDVWNGAPPAGVASTLQSHISLLRPLLGAERIRATGRAVLLEVADGELDSDSFEGAVRHGSEALRAGYAAEASELIGGALELWRGPALTDVAGSVWALPEVTRLNAELWFGGQIMTISWLRGTLGELVPLIEQAVTDYPGFRVFVAVLAHAHAEGDRPDVAASLLEAFAATDFDLPLDGLWLTGMMSYAEAAIRCRAAEQAQPLLDRLGPWADRFSYFDGTAAGPVSHAVGALAALLGRYDEAQRYFAQSSQFSDQVGSKFFGARTHLSWGTMLVDRGAPEDAGLAGELLRKAQTVAAAHGYRNVELRAGAALANLESIQA